MTEKFPADIMAAAEETLDRVQVTTSRDGQILTIARAIAAERSRCTGKALFWARRMAMEMEKEE